MDIGSIRRALLLRVIVGGGGYMAGYAGDGKLVLLIGRWVWAELMTAGYLGVRAEFA